MSPREELAHELADTCTFGGLDESYGVMVSKQEDPKGKEYWSVTFAKARYLDGVIKVYSPTFVLVKWQGMGGGSEVLRSGHAAKQFLTNNFVAKFI